MIDIFLQASNYPTQFFLCIAIALFPIGIWMAIFLNKSEKNPWYIVLTFIFGMMSAGAILLYQSFWGDQPLNFIFFGVEAYNFKANIAELVTGVILIPFLTYMGVGFLEEILKHYAVVKADKNIISSVGEAIELSIIAALGFAFLENIAYFYREFLTGGMSPNFWTLAIQRSIFVVFVHIICSAIYGYYYGLGIFAKPYMQYEYSQYQKRFWFAELLHKIFNVKRAYVFRERMMLTGIIVATVLHGLYDFAMHMNPTFMIGNSAVQLHVMLLPVMLVGGILFLTYLLRQKENLEEFGTLEVEYVYKKIDAQEIRDMYNVQPRLSRFHRVEAV
ncbi:TPA: PrsW family intramembrane metalloprotease [Candidatus Gracilibacteria bacterium]|nr:PrsW family intramembrane metalloprotease [Candidatus Gracilibacteria bacterium]HIQ57631.1 PrsW family intramembrane metalloprotease [Candidatus Gracilibacteria bacterium]